MLQSGSFHSKLPCSASRAGHNPVGPLQGFEDPQAFRLLQNVAKSGIVFGIRSGGLLLRKTSRLQFQIGNIEVKHRPCRNNDSSFDHILEFAYVPGPLVSAQRVHRRGWNRVNHLVHAPAELLRKNRSDRNFCSATMASKLRLVAAIRRAFVRRVFELPSLSNSRSCSTRRSFVCNSRGISPISSRKIVPLSSTSKRPMRCAIAPVNAPFSCPTSSLSSKPVGIAAQFSFTTGFERRGLKS